jgi:hypothetical protein
MANDEAWKPVVKFERKYEVSDQGRVRSLDRIIVNSLGVRRPHHGRVLRPQNGPHGYKTVHLGTEFMNRYVHHLVARAFLGKAPKGKEVLHNNGNKNDCRLVNLRYGTRTENMRDMVRHRYEQAWVDYAAHSRGQTRLGGVDKGSH